MSKKRPCAHGGRSHYFIQGEGFTSSVIRYAGQEMPMMAAGGGEAEMPDEDNAFRFCRMFERNDDQPDDEALIDLGLIMNETGVGEEGDTSIPAGYTYFGQFVDHDITLDATMGFNPTDPTTVENLRTPGLDLDNVYGMGPDDDADAEHRVAYEDDGLHLKIGQTTGRAIFGPEFEVAMPNDLPRRPKDDSDAGNSRRALIGDPRNDENLIVAQMHLAMLKFHNKVVDDLGIASLSQAQKVTRQHYQSVVLHDFVAKIAEQETFNDVLANGRKFFLSEGLPDSGRACMPVEFSVAAYRQHSMIRNSYEWNKVFSTTGGTEFPPSPGVISCASSIRNLHPISARFLSSVNNSRLS